MKAKAGVRVSESGADGPAPSLQAWGLLGDSGVGGHEDDGDSGGDEVMLLTAGSS